MVKGLVDTLESPKQVLNQMHGIIEELNNGLNEFNSAGKNDIKRAKAEQRMILTFDKLKLKNSKFEMSVIKLIIDTAEKLGQLGKNYPGYHQQIETVLDKIEKLFKDIRESEKMEIRKSRYLGRTAHHLMKRTDHIGDDVNKFYKDFVRHHKQNQGNK